MFCKYFSEVYEHGLDVAFEEFKLLYGYYMTGNDGFLECSDIDRGM